MTLNKKIFKIMFYLLKLKDLEQLFNLACTGYPYPIS